MEQRAGREPGDLSCLEQGRLQQDNGTPSGCQHRTHSLGTSASQKKQTELVRSDPTEEGRVWRSCGQRQRCPRCPEGNPRMNAMHFWTKRDEPVQSSEVRPSSFRTLESEPEYLQFSQRDKDAANKD